MIKLHLVMDATLLSVLITDTQEIVTCNNNKKFEFKKEVRITYTWLS